MISYFSFHAIRLNDTWTLFQASSGPGFLNVRFSRLVRLHVIELSSLCVKVPTSAFQGFRCSSLFIESLITLPTTFSSFVNYLAASEFSGWAMHSHFIRGPLCGLYVGGHDALSHL